MYRRRWTERIFDVIEGLEPIAAEKEVSLSQFSLAWVMAQPGVTSPIIGPRTMEQLEDNLQAIGVKVTDEDRKRVNEVIPPGHMVSPFYEGEFGPHPYRV
jgi:aryl-alcohol dehydrogenase-like predicted oxidoreductase